MPRALFLLTISLAGLGIAVVTGLLAWLGFSATSRVEWSLLDFAVFAVAFCFGALPYGLVAKFASGNRDSVLALGASLATLTVIMALGVMEYHNSFVINPDTQGALIFLFLPFLQVIVTLPLFLVRTLYGFFRRGV